MKKVVAIAVCLSLLLQCMAQLIVLGCFAANRDYIAKNLCENRNKPQLKCCGKCYLRKHLKQVDGESSSSKNAPQKLEKNEAVAYILPVPAAYPAPKALSEAPSIRTPRLQRLYGVGLSPSIFHPPALAA